MVRFQCIHCGARIAVPSNHLGRLARCPECGGVTHPLAEHIAAPADSSKTAVAENNRVPGAPAKATVAPPPPEAVQCDNCGAPLGKLQKPFEWDGHQVCGACYRELSLEKAPAPALAESPVSAQSAIATVEPVMPMTAPPILQPPAPAPVATPIVVTAAPVVSVAPSRGATKTADYVVAFRGAAIGLVATALALYIIVKLLESIGGFIIWGGIVVAVIAAVYWVRRGIASIRRKFSFGSTER